jgi:hypothetical protein
MKKEKLYEAIGEINENYISDAHQTAKRKSNRAWLQICVMAACFALIVGLGIGGFNFLKGHNGDLPGEILQNPTQQDTSKDNHNDDTVIDNPIILWNDYSEVQDAGFTEWNGKTITLSLYDALSDTKNKDSLIAIGVGFEIDTNFVYNGKSLAQYALEADAERLLGGKLGQLLKLGDSLKYGDALYKTGTPTGEKWSKELYDETVETIGKDLIAKYIVDGEFLVEKLEADIAACGENKQCLIAYEEARNAFCRFAVNEAVKTLEGKNINYEIRNETGLVFFITADEFASLHLDNVSHFGFASKDGDGMDFVEESTDD